MNSFKKYRGHIKEYLYVTLNTVPPKAIQQALGNVAVDGQIGRNTLAALIQADPKVFYHALADILDTPVPVTKDNEEKSKKDTLMDYLAKAEGLKVHWNKGERTYTSPYGVYKFANRNARVIKFIDRRAKELGFNLSTRSPRTLVKFNRALTVQDKQTIRDLAYELYLTKYIDHKLEPYLTAKELKTFFSISVVAGIGTARRAAQFALHTTTDGKIGRGTISKIVQDKPADFNLGMVNGARRHFANIIKHNPALAKYRRGWENRMKGLL